MCHPRMLGLSNINSKFDETLQRGIKAHSVGFAYHLMVKGLTDGITVLTALICFRTINSERGLNKTGKATLRVVNSQAEL